MIKLSIAIPTYNGASTIQDAIESVIPQINEAVEIVISDNGSTDKTPAIIREYQQKYGFIKYFRNEQNLGMDKNFDLAVKRSTGKFIWLLSDNETLTDKHAIEKILATIDKYPDLGIIYANYENTIIPIDKDYLCTTGDEFFMKTGCKNVLISSNIVNKNIWESLNIDKYNGTLWTQVGFAIEAAAKYQSYVTHEILIQQIADERVKPRWGLNGGFFKVGLDLVKMFKGMSKYGYSQRAVRNCVLFVKKRNWSTIAHAKAKGLKVNNALIKYCIELFGNFPSFWLIDLPLLLMPNIIFKFLYYLYGKYRNMRKA